MTKDLSNNILGIQYNVLNLPNYVNMVGDSIIHKFIYDMDGRKLYSNVSNTNNWTIRDEIHYCDNMIYKEGVLDRILLDGYGYYTVADQQYHWYQKDHLGNNRLVVNQNGTIEQVSHYYPYGNAFAEGLQNANNPYRYNGKELDPFTNWYDYSARYMDPALGRFTTPDPMAEKYYNVSPYAYCMDNPVNAVDTDGKVVLFINGFNFGDGGQSAYWSGMDQVAMNKIGDYNARYYDGSLTNGYGYSLRPSNRREAGEAMGYSQAKDILGGLKGDETIKIISHSMGGAYSKGMISGIRQYASEQDIDVNGKFEFEVDLAPYQPTLQNVRRGVKTIQVSHDDDNVASGDKERGVSNANYHLTPGGHNISSFGGDIKKYVPTSSHNAPGKSAWNENTDALQNAENPIRKYNRYKLGPNMGGW